MFRFQVANIKVLEGVSRTTQRPYKMMAVSGILTNPDGSIEVGETVFMEGANRPLPLYLKAGQSYDALVVARVRDGKFQFEIGELRPAASVKAAA